MSTEQREGFWKKIARPKIAGGATVAVLAILSYGTSGKEGGFWESVGGIIKEGFNPRFHAVGWTVFLAVLGATWYYRRQRTKRLKTV